MAMQDQLVPTTGGNTQAQTDGQWQYVVDPKTLPPGYHTVQATDDQGGTYEAGLYIEPAQPTTDAPPLFVVQESVSIVDRVKTVIPEAGAWAVLALFVVVLCLAAIGVRQVWRARRHAAVETTTSYPLKWKLAFGGIAGLVAIAIGIIVWSSRTPNTFTPMVNRVRSTLGTAETAPREVAVSGRFVDPRNPAQSVVGIDLVSGDTAIRTQEGGRFQFEAVSEETGIRLTHPSLMRAFVWVPVARVENSEVPFDPSLLNAIVTRADAEARGDQARVQTLFVEGVQAPSAVFTAADTLRQEIAFHRLLRVDAATDATGKAQWDQVIRMELARPNAAASWDLVYASDGWRFIR